MAVPITPNTSVYLLKCPLEMDNQNQLNFANATAQFNYFNSLPKIEFDNFTYQRHDGVLRINEHIDDLMPYTYVMYQNDNYSDKWFYAFITSMEYVNDNCTYVSIKMDVWQTYQFDIHFHECFVNREHVNDDTFGKHILMENIPAGEFVCNNFSTIGLKNPKDCWIIAEVTELLNGMTGTTGFRDSAREYNGVASGTWKIGIKVDPNAPANEKYVNLSNIIYAYDWYGKSDAILNLYMIPKEILPSDYVTEASFEINDQSGTYLTSFDGFIIGYSASAYSSYIDQVQRNTTLDGYTPKNNKMFTKQFNYLMLSNNSGASYTYNWEDFNGTPSFETKSVIMQGCQTKTSPTNYKGAGAVGGNAWAIPYVEFPIISWKSDYYLNYQAKQGWNAMGTHFRKLGQLGQEGVKSADGGVDVGATVYQMAHEAMNLGVSAFRGVVNTLNGSMENAERQPDQIAGNGSTATLTFSDGLAKISVFKMSVKASNAKIIDDYFSAFGYQISDYKLPNITGRLNWNYVKLNTANITADIPQQYLEEIKAMFINGITIWHNPSTYLDYTQPNTIL